MYMRIINPGEICAIMQMRNAIDGLEAANGALTTPVKFAGTNIYALYYIFT